jgi:hypothetical protein
MFQDRVRILIERLSDRLPTAYLAGMRTDARCGEEGCAMSELVAVVVKDDVALSADEAAEMRACIAGMEMDAEILDMLISLSVR